MKSSYRKIVVSTILGMSTVSLAGTYSGGDGTETDPYQISTTADWQELIETPDDYDTHFVLTTDLDFGGSPIIPVGMNEPFAGSFDGQGHVITDPVINVQDLTVIGLFGSLDGGVIRNLRVENISVAGLAGVGGLAGIIRGDARIRNCHVSGTVSGSGNTGGLAGDVSFCVIERCYSECIVNGGGGDSVGGLVGRMQGGTCLSYCSATGTVNGGKRVGGLIGQDYFGGHVSNCYANCTVSGDSLVGGLIGWCSNLGAQPVFKCYAAGQVSGQSNIGGLIGKSAVLVEASFWDKQVSGLDTSEGGVALSTEEMKNPVTYLRAFWDFKGEIKNGTADIWAIPDGGGYPVFSWQLDDSPVENDEMAAAIAVEAEAEVSGTTIGATGLDITRNGYNDFRDIWYRFHSEETAEYTVTLEPTDPSTFDTTLTVFDDVQREVAFNDDFFGKKSVVILKAKAGQQYYIRVSGVDGQTGDFTLSVTQGAIQAIQGDLNYDGIVDLRDFALIGSKWLLSG